MVVLQVIATLLVYVIAWRPTGRRAAAFISAVLFSLTPLAIISHRRVLLDNIMVVWFLASVYFLTKTPKIRNFIFSAVAFAIAVLTKEPALFFLPPLVYLAWRACDKTSRHFVFVIWLSIIFLAVSIYPLLAMLKGEFFPSGTWLGGQEPHVSLIEAVAFQASREGGFLLSSDSTFQFALKNTWIVYGGIPLSLAVVAVFISLIRPANYWQRGFSLLSLSYVLFILKGEILDWYIIPLIATSALNLSGLYLTVLNWGRRLKIRERWTEFGFVTSFVAIIIYSLAGQAHIFTVDQTSNQRQAVEWIRQHLGRESVALIDNYPFVDLNPSLGKDITEANIHYYWKADTDPQITHGVLNDDWQTIDYLLITPAIKRTLDITDLDLVETAYDNSFVVKRFANTDLSLLDYPVDIREVNNRDGTLSTSWRYYRDRFILPEGRVVDPTAGSETTSEGQSYALLRSVWENDRATFDQVLAWTESALSNPETGLFAWRYGQSAPGGWGVLDPASASDADEDVALALLFASRRWGDDSYAKRAQQLLADIWDQEVVEIDGRLHLLAGTQARRGDGYLVNPSYFAPAHYRIFAEADTQHNWYRLAADSYRIIRELENLPTGGQMTNLLPNWVVVDKNGAYRPLSPGRSSPSDQYGYDSFRLMWRLALDYVWFDAEEAKNYLGEVFPFFRDEWNRHGKIYAVYSTAGVNQVPYDDISTYAGAMSIFSVIDPDLAIELYAKSFWSEYQRGYWGDGDNYYNQNWGWFATALYARDLPNLWQNPDGKGSLARTEGRRDDLAGKKTAPGGPGLSFKLESDSH